jgi:hypothetical protein
MSLLAILITLTILALLFFAGWSAGAHYGYQKGVRDVAEINDLSFKNRTEVETENLSKRAKIDGEAYKERLANALDYEQKLRALPNANISSVPN